MAKKYVYNFHEGNGSMRELLGGKGANLAEMMNLGMPVPYGFTVTTEACNQYYADDEKISVGIIAEIMNHLRDLEEESGKEFGSPENPLFGFCSFWSSRQHAWYDGYYLKFRFK